MQAQVLADANGQADRVAALDHLNPGPGAAEAHRENGRFAGVFHQLAQDRQRQISQIDRCLGQHAPVDELRSEAVAAVILTIEQPLGYQGFQEAVRGAFRQLNPLADLGKGQHWLAPVKTVQDIAKAIDGSRS